METAQKALEKAVTDAESKVLEFRARLEQRFDVWMGQVESAYRNQMLLVTVVIGAIVVSLLNADAFSVYRALGTNPKAREAIIAHVQDVAQQTLSSKAEDLNAIHAFVQAGEQDKAKAKALELCGKLAEDFKAYKDEAMAAKANEIGQSLQSADGASALIDREAELASLFVKLNRTAVETHAGDVAGLDLPLGWSREKKAFAGATVTSPVVVHKIAGLLLTIFLITFGAPFWNDILGAITGVKNALGKKKDKPSL